MAKFESLWRNGNEAKNINKYIPARLADAIQDTTVDSDGYWIYLNEGWKAYDGYDDCGTIHEYTIKDLKAAIKTIQSERG